MSLPVIGITMGDPGGVGPEVVAKALSSYSGKPFKAILFGSRLVFSQSGVQNYLKGLSFIECRDVFELDVLEKGTANKLNGQASYAYINAALDAVEKEGIQGLVTAPICKASFKLAKVPFTGHTTLLQDKTGSDSVSMAFYTERLKVVLATVHVPLHLVSQCLTEEALERAIRHAYLFSELCSIKKPKIAVAGLNPHAGEGGLFGVEEKQLLYPVIQRLAKDNIPVSGPYPADTLFHRAYEGDFDVVVALYHDQGLIPVKLLGFHEAVNISLGLPFIRTSPDHGTAFDIAYQDKANPSSFKAALELALRLI